MEPVFAYIDPASGSLLIQAAIAALVAAPFVLRHQIARFVAKIKGEQPEPAVPDASAAAAAADADTHG